MKKPFCVEYTGFIENTLGHTCVVRVPDEFCQSFADRNVARVTVDMGKSNPVHLALHPRKDEEAFFYLSKAQQKELQVLPGEELKVILCEDTSTYQAPEPEEWMELVAQDEEIRHRFESLTMGQKRSILFMVNRLKSTDARLRKALLIAENLRMGFSKPEDLNKRH